MDEKVPAESEHQQYSLGLGSPDPFQRPRRFWPTLFNAVLATALFRCWHILIFFAAWSTAICVISHKVVNLGISSTLLTVLGTVLGFVISYRTTSSFERYNEGRRYWSQIVLASRTFARMVWFHVPETMAGWEDSMPISEKKARVIVEKKTVINLLEAFAVAVKHYLRGEDGIYYVDLYHLVKCLPAYSLPAGIPSQVDLTGQPPMSPIVPSLRERRPSDVKSTRTTRSQPNIRFSEQGNERPPPLPTSFGIPPNASDSQLPMPVTTSTGNGPQSPTSPNRRGFMPTLRPIKTNQSGRYPRSVLSGRESIGDDFLLPARMPPKYHLFDLFPFSLLVKALTKRGKEVKGKKGARLRAKLKSQAVTSHNLPLEISLYLSSYIAALQTRKALDPPTITIMIQTLNQLVDALTGLERILTTPIPFSYSVHLWTVTLLYCLFLPFQLWLYLGWVTIPGTVIACFIFFGFLVAGEEIENPFGYDKNDLNMDHFTSNIIRYELRAITAAPAPDPQIWAFSPANDHIFASAYTHSTSGGAVQDAEEGAQGHMVGSPEEWVGRGLGSIRGALARV